MQAFEHPDDADCMELARRLASWFCSYVRTRGAKSQRDVAAPSH
jgi:hypothetical protein